MDSRSDSMDEDDGGYDDGATGRMEGINAWSRSSDNPLPHWYGDGGNDSDSADDDNFHLNYDFDDDDVSLLSCNTTEERYAIVGSSSNYSHPSSTTSIILREFAINMLRTYNPEYIRLELDDRIDDVICLSDAIRNNRTVREVEVHIEALEGLSLPEQMQLADAICSLQELRSLLVYKNSALFIEPLLRHSPYLLENLRMYKLDVFSDPLGVNRLVSALKGLPSLSSLDVLFDSTECDDILEALGSLKDVYVKLQSFQVDYKVLEGLGADALETNGCHKLDDRIVVAIAEAVEQSQTLKKLVLPPYNCTERCYDVLIGMLRNNFTLERIDYWVRVCNLYYPDMNETIDHLLHLNQTGARRLVQQTNISSSEVLQLMIHSSKDDIESAYHLFSSHPSLLPVTCPSRCSSCSSNNNSNYYSA